MVSPELACVYGNYFNTANDTAMALYHASWTSYIQRLRNVRCAQWFFYSCSCCSVSR